MCHRRLILTILPTVLLNESDWKIIFQTFQIFQTLWIEICIQFASSSKVKTDYVNVLSQNDFIVVVKKSILSLKKLTEEIEQDKTLTLSSSYGIFGLT